MGPFGFNEEEEVGDAHWVPLTYNGEASAVVRRQDVGDTWGRSSSGSSRNAVDDDLYRETAARSFS